MGKFFNVTVLPDLTRDTGTVAATAAFGNSDIIFDWTPFDIPKGSAQLKSIEAIIRGTDGADQLGSSEDFELIFAKSVNGNAPSTLGVINQAVTGNTVTGTGVGWFRNIIGSIFMDATNCDDGGNLIFVNTLSANFEALRDCPVLTGEPDSGTNVGFDKLYVAAYSRGAVFNFGTGVLLNETDAGNLAAAGTATLTINGTDARKVFQEGDVVVAADGAACGTIKTLTHDGTDGTLVLEAAHTDALANDDELLNKNPIRLELSFER